MKASPSINDSIQQLLALLNRIPNQARRSFARTQLGAAHQALLDAFDRIPATKVGSSILFLSVQPHSREVRLGEALRTQGLTVISVTSSRPKQETQKAFSFSYVIEDPFFLALVSWAFPGPIVHAFALRGDHLHLLALMKPKTLIVDLYDTAAGTFSKTSPETLTERLVLEKADGVVHRDTRIHQLGKQGYKLPAHSLFLHDPISRSPRKTPLAASGEIHVVSVGWVSHGANSIARVLRRFLECSIHCHIYFNPLQAIGYPETLPYLELSKEFNHLHIEQPLYGESYWTALGQYDFGLSILEPSIFGEYSTGYSSDALEHCGSSRLSDYISAGLGVIVSPELRFQHFWARRFARTTVIASAALLASPREVLLQAASTARDRDLSPISTQASGKRLFAFYTRVLGRTGTYQKTRTPDLKPLV